MREMSAYINAGGRGTRLEGVAPADPVDGIAKALIEVGEPPIKLVDHHINRLKKAGIERVVVGIGHQARVGSYVDDRYGGDDGVYAVGTGRQLGSGAELQTVTQERPELFRNSIYICNVDTILDIPERDFLRVHKTGGKVLSIALTRATGVPNEGSYYLDYNGAVIYCAEVLENPISIDEARAKAESRASSTGAVIVERDYIQDLELPQVDGEVSLYRHVIGAALRDHQVAGFDNGKRMFMDVGTRDTWGLATKTDVLKGHLCYAVE